jgi:hypothetical protein
MIVPEGIFVKVGLQVLGTHGMVDPVDPALQKTPKTVHCVRVNVADHVHFCGVLDSPMPIAKPANLIVAAKLIGVNGRPASNRVAQDRQQSFGLYVDDLTCNDSAFALDNSRDYAFAFRSASTLSTSATANVSFIHLHIAAKFSALLV